MPPIYLDYASTTPVDSHILQEFIRVSQDIWGNPSATHQMGQKARAVLEQARYRVAKTLNCTPAQIVFTTTATEANNIVLQSVAQFYVNQGVKPHILVSNIEHASVSDFVNFPSGNVETYPVQPNGIVNIDEIVSRIRPETVLISLMLASNEIGTIQPVQDLVTKIGIINAKRKIQNLPHIRVHTDAVQTPLWMKLDVEELGVDFMILSGHKMYAPKGCGVLFVKDSHNMAKVVFGGGQEREIRSGTQNLAAIHATSLALEQAQDMVSQTSSDMKTIQNYGYELVHKYLPTAIINGDLINRLPNNIHITIPTIDQIVLHTKLDLAGILVSSGSSCGSGSNQRSSVMKAIGNNRQGGDIRISMGRDTTREELSMLCKFISTNSI